MTDANLTSAISSLLSNKDALVAYAVEFVLGLGVGYVLARGLKYIIAFFVLLVVGDVLNVWSINGLNLSSITSGLSSGNVTALAASMRPVLETLSLLQPIFTSSIILIGFLIGAAIAFFR